MSIYGSLGAPDSDEHEEDCARWIKEDNVWRAGDKPCDCGQPDAPLVYQGSHVFPSENDPRGGWVDIAVISSFLTPDANDDAPIDGPPHPFLRFGVNAETVVLTERNVRQIADTLNWWLLARKVGIAAANAADTTEAG